MKREFLFLFRVFIGFLEFFDRKFFEVRFEVVGGEILIEKMVFCLSLRSFDGRLGLGIRFFDY